MKNKCEIGETVFKKFEYSLKSDLRLSIYKDCFSCSTLWLRPIFPEDYHHLMDYFMNPTSMKYWGKGCTYSPKEIKNLISKSASSNVNLPETSGWSVITHDGVAGCFWASKNELGTEVEIAYVCRPGFSGRGLTTEEGRLILDSKFSAPNFEGKIIATAHPNNRASQRVLEKLGLQPDPERQNVPKYGSLRNYYQCVVKEESPVMLHAFHKSRALPPLTMVRSGIGRKSDAHGLTRPSC